MSLLEMRRLSVTFQSGETRVEAVKALDLTIDKGEFLAVVGESGSGKSVTAQAIMRLLPGSAQVTGHIAFDGEDLTALPDSALRHIRGKRIGMVFQEPMSALNPLHTIGRQIGEMIALHQPELKGDAKQRHMAELLEQVGLSDFAHRLDAWPHQLSGGQRQRVMIAMAMANAPDLLIADEPTTALDVTLQAQILALLRRLQRERGLSVLLITHDLSIVRHLADRVCVMRRGEIVESGPTQQLFNAPSHAYTKQLLAAIPQGTAVALPDQAREVLRCDDLSVFFERKKGLFARSVKPFCAVNQASLSLREGETLGLVGESGSGKTTLALAILRLLESRGPILYLGQRIDQRRGKAMRGLRSDIQVVFQDPYASLNPRMSVLELITEGLSVHRRDLSRDEHRRRAEAIMEDVGLERAMLQRYAHEFSGGQRQRIAIARAMILSPQLVVLDEPTSALDVSVQAQILDLLKRFQRDAHVSYLFISHDLRVIRAISHRVAVMQAGRIIETGASESLFATPQHAYTRRLIQTAFDPLSAA